MPVISTAERVQQASFQRTRTVVQRDNILLGFGIAYLIAPLSLMFSGTHITWLMVRNNPFQALFFVVAGVICLLLRVISSVGKLIGRGLDLKHHKGGRGTQFAT